MRIHNLIASITAIRSSIFHPKLINTKPVCGDCKFFIGNDQTCGKLGKTNLITGKQEHQYASLVRYDNNKCGEDGIFFEENKFKFLTAPYYWLTTFWPFIFFPFP